MRPDDETEMVRLGRALLLLHQLCQFACQRGHQADPQLLHAVHIGCGDVLSAESATHDTTMGKCHAVRVNLRAIRSINIFNL